MAFIEKIPAVEEVEYSHEGYFDIKKAYNAVYGILGERYFFDMTEKLYSYNTTKSGDKNFSAKATAEAEFTDYLKIFFIIIFKAEGSNEEVKVEGVNKILTKGKFTLKFRAYLEPEWAEKREHFQIVQFLSVMLERVLKQPSSEEKAIKKAKDMANVLKEEFFKHMF